MEGSERRTLKDSSDWITSRKARLELLRTVLRRRRISPTRQRPLGVEQALGRWTKGIQPQPTSVR
jgi:hypothetical protein